MTNKQSKMSFRRYFQLFSIGMVLPMLLVVIVLMAFSFRQYNIRYRETAQLSVNQYARSIGQSLGEVESYLANLAVVDSDYALLTGAASPLSAHMAVHGIVSQFRTAIKAYSAADAFFVCSEVNQMYRDVFGDSFDYEEQSALRLFVRELAAQGDNWYSTGWTVQEAGDKPYLIYIVGKDGTYLVGVVDFDESLDVLLGGDILAFYAGEDAVPLGGPDWLRELSPPPQHTTPFYTGTNGEFLAVSSPIVSTDLALFLLAPRLQPFRQLTSLQILLAAFALLSVLNGLVLFLVSRRTLVSPLEGFAKKVMQGEQPPEASHFSELRQMGNAFSSMRSTIQELEIAAYRQEINRQRAELQYLQLQIRPHFYLNCLKTLYGMSQMQRTEPMQEMILAVSRHLRYCFSDARQMIPFSQEMSHVDNYLAIQKLGQGRKILLRMQIDDELEELAVPPFVLQTFVENSIKYGGYDLEISILAERKDGLLHLVVSDNGAGYPPEYLEMLEQGEAYDPNHIGLYNCSFARYLRNPKL
ncbi:MAG: sensor histidine kinase [Oscillospiraceae bacterium]